uniref:Uncharacterized protein n=1 Tax=Helianthus annuus TaxID=4232 RepID=A0A251VCZ7_HELAN
MFAMIRMQYNVHVTVSLYVGAHVPFPSYSSASAHNYKCKHSSSSMACQIVHVYIPSFEGCL